LVKCVFDLPRKRLVEKRRNKDVADLGTVAGRNRARVDGHISLNRIADEHHFARCFARGLHGEHHGGTLRSAQAVAEILRNCLSVYSEDAVVVLYTSMFSRRTGEGGNYYQSSSLKVWLTVNTHTYKLGVASQLRFRFCDFHW
jgi:hypothetical protein